MSYSLECFCMTVCVYIVFVIHRCNKAVVECSVFMWGSKELGSFEINLCSWQGRMVDEGCGFRKERGRKDII